jgi:hypothetical protein
MTVFRISDGETGSGHLKTGRIPVTGLRGSPEMQDLIGGLWVEITTADDGKPLQGSGTCSKTRVKKPTPYRARLDLFSGKMTGFLQKPAVFGINPAFFTSEGHDRIRQDWDGGKRGTACQGTGPRPEGISGGCFQSLTCGGKIPSLNRAPLYLFYLITRQAEAIIPENEVIIPGKTRFSRRRNRGNI